MKALISIEVPDEWLERRVREYNEDSANDDPPGRQTTPSEYMLNVIRDTVVEDSLPLTLFTWPIEASVELVPD